MDLNESCPAWKYRLSVWKQRKVYTVSQIWTFIFLLLFMIVLEPNSTPMVVSCWFLKLLSVNWRRRHDFPTSDGGKIFKGGDQGKIYLNHQRWWNGRGSQNCSWAFWLLICLFGKDEIKIKLLILILFLPAIYVVIFIKKLNSILILRFLFNLLILIYYMMALWFGFKLILF